MKKIVLLVMIAAVAFSMSACSILDEMLASTIVVEENGFTAELPKSFERDYEEGYFYGSMSKEMYFEWRYYAKEFDLDAEVMLEMLLYNEYSIDDVNSFDDVEINGVDGYQAEYRTLTTGNDNIHYYYSGVVTVLEGDDEFLVIDAYKFMEESVGINTTISDEDMQTLLDMVNSVDYDGDSGETSSISETIYGNALALNLSSNWDEYSEGENGFYDWGYFASYAFSAIPLVVDIYESDDESATDMSTVMDDYLQYSNYEYIGDVVIGGEAGYAFKYTADGAETPFFYGVIGITEHYTVDLYVMTMYSEYIMPDDTVDAFYEMISSIQ